MVEEPWVYPWCWDRTNRDLRNIRRGFGIRRVHVHNHAYKVVNLWDCKLHELGSKTSEKGTVGHNMNIYASLGLIA